MLHQVLAWPKNSQVVRHFLHGRQVSDLDLGRDDILEVPIVLHTGICHGIHATRIVMLRVRLSLGKRKARIQQHAPSANGPAIWNDACKVPNQLIKYKQDAKEARPTVHRNSHRFRDLVARLGASDAELLDTTLSFTIVRFENKGGIPSPLPLTVTNAEADRLAALPRSTPPRSKLPAPPALASG